MLVFYTGSVIGLCTSYSSLVMLAAVYAGLAGLAATKAALILLYHVFLSASFANVMVISTRYSVAINPPFLTYKMLVDPNGHGLQHDRPKTNPKLSGGV